MIFDNIFKNNKKYKVVENFALKKTFDVIEQLTVIEKVKGILHCTFEEALGISKADNVIQAMVNYRIQDPLSSLLDNVKGVGEKCNEKKAP